MMRQALSRVELEIAYRLAARRLRGVGEHAAAGRFERRAAGLAGGVALERPSIASAIGHAADAGGARIAARLDAGNARLWTAIAEDQSRLAAIHLPSWNR